MDINRAQKHYDEEVHRYPALDTGTYYRMITYGLDTNGRLTLSIPLAILRTIQGLLKERNVVFEYRAAPPIMHTRPGFVRYTVYQRTLQNT